MNYMAMAGWKTSDMLSGIEGIMNLAAASGEDLASTSDIVTDALTAFRNGQFLQLAFQDGKLPRKVILHGGRHLRRFPVTVCYGAAHLLNVRRGGVHQRKECGLSALWGILAANPVTLVIAAIAALIAIFVALWNNCEGYSNGVPAATAAGIAGAAG